MDTKKRYVVVQIVLLCTSLFSFSLSVSNHSYSDSAMREDSVMNDLFLKIKDSLNRPVIPFVSAQSDPSGCCELSITNEVCSTTTKSACLPTAQFAEGSLCSQTSFCKAGCCYNPEIGSYDKGVLEQHCAFEWDADPSCNIPGAEKGCCVLETLTKFETLVACEIDTEVLGLGDGVVDWRPDVNEAECSALQYETEEGACVLSGGECTITTGESCVQLGGDFAPGILCTSPSLQTSCVPTEETTCLSSKPGVYFLDSCGNPANMYDASKIESESYWDHIISVEDSCNADAEDGNADNPLCGNCNPLEGGLCASALESPENPEYGGFICKDISCEYKDVTYENGESWCVYDGVIGGGDDVVGSRHWKYVCNQGSVQVEPCADFRNEICVQSNTEVDGVVVNSNAQCVINSAKNCLVKNTEDGGISQCTSVPDCFVETVDIDSHFTFDVCLPEYPRGTDVKSPSSQQYASETCGIASQTCKVTRKANLWGSCKIDKNADCLTAEFGEKMNDLCRSLGDCGAETNIVGAVSDDYLIKGSKPLSDSYMGYLASLATPIPGQFAPASYADYTEYLNLLAIFNLQQPGTNEYDFGDYISNLWTIFFFGFYIVLDFFGFWDCDPIKVEFECKPSQPPVGGSDCELCNGDPLKPCSTYRCQSLGTSCELINIGSDNELCVDSAPNDVAPPILSPQIGTISEGIMYADISDNGFSLVGEGDSCIPANNPLFFGITTNEPAYCKYDFEEKSFEGLEFDLGGNFYIYNHTAGLIVPEPSHIEILSNGTWNGDLELFVKCEDTKGHISPEQYVVSMCVKEGLDISAPFITKTSPDEGSLVSFDVTSTNAEIITNELATCRWSTQEVSYEAMTNMFSCADSFGIPSSPFGYVCNASLPLEVNQTEYAYFVSCADQPWFIGTENESKINVMQEVFEYTLYKPSSKIAITSLSPSGQIKIPTPSQTIDFEVVTTGGGVIHSCEYSFSGYQDMIAFFETGVLKTHTQQFNLGEGDYTVYVQCSDETGDSVQDKVSFEIIEDDSAPEIASISAKDGILSFTTTESAECRYATSACKFDWDEASPAGFGEEHEIAVVSGQEYHIKCEDEFGNVPSSCQMSIVVV